VVLTSMRAPLIGVIVEPRLRVPTRNSVHSVIIEVSKFRLLTSHTGNLVEEPPMLCVPFPGVIYNIKDKRSSRDN
jgi:hypothetical protein